jgi:zinc transporter, ZIP family
VENLGESLTWGAVIAASLLAGAIAAALLNLPSRVAAVLTALGGGTLLSAVALELLPEADERAGTALTALGLLAGTLVYVGADAWLDRNSHTRELRRIAHAAAAGRPTEMPKDLAEAARGQSIAAGIFIDGVPESAALGLTVAEGSVGVALLAGILIGNLVEAYGASQPILAGGRSKRFAIGLLGAIGGALVVATVLGATLLADAPAEVIGAAQAVAAGAVLAVVAIAVIPHAFEEVSRTVALATTAGFVVGYLLS